jgi:hypothetical protein
MDVAFMGEKDKFMVIYLDDITIFSKLDDEHLQQLERIFRKCRRYGISLNSKKSHFAMPKGKLLGHIISTGGIKIDPKRVEAIQEIEILRNKKSIQSFIGRINHKAYHQHAEEICCYQVVTGGKINIPKDQTSFG